MGSNYVTASKSLIAATGQEIKLTSVICTPIAASDSAFVTLYNATAATANTEVLSLRCGSGSRSICWSDPSGINVRDNLYVTVNSAYATIVWD